MTRIKRYFSFVVFVTLLVTPLVHSSPSLNVTVATDKSSYGIGESVGIYVNLTDGSPIQNGLVALEVDKPSGSSLLFRTLQTETPPTPTQVNITEVTLLDSMWQPKDSFDIGETGMVLIRVRSLVPPLVGDINGDGLVNLWDKGLLSDAWLTESGDPDYNPDADLNGDGFINLWDKGVLSDNWLRVEPEALRVWVTMTMYDAENVPIIENLNSFPLGTNVTQAWTPQFWIPQNAFTGSAAVYACAFTNLTKDGGTPYCPEVSKAFTITGSMSSSVNGLSSYQATATYGDYTSTFQVPPNANPGTYTVYVASSYGEEQATDNTTFEVTSP